MDRCPIEVWNHIFTFACTDNGFTGRSLSLVSRYIHDTSKSVKLQSLSVTKPQQIHGLARLIANTPPKYRRVGHLFIASPNDDGDVLAAFLSIIRALAPTITTLHVHFPFYRRSLFVPGTATFPSLVELTLYGPYTDHDNPLPTTSVEDIMTSRCPGYPPPLTDHDNPSTTTSEEDTITSPSLSGYPPPLPSLRRLHLANLHYNPTKCFRHITCVAPSLTHLRIPYQISMANSLLTGLGARALSHPTSSSNSYGVTVGTLPSTIEMVLIDPGRPHTCFGPFGCGRGKRRRYADLQNFKKVIKEDKRIYMLAEQLNGMEEAEQYWLDRIEGGEGSWMVPKHASDDILVS